MFVNVFLKILKRISQCFVLLIVFIFMQGGLIQASESLDYDHDQYNQFPNDIVRLHAEAGSMFYDSYKSFLSYTVIQNVPGVKESAVGYYYDHNSKRLTKNYFYRFENGFPRETEGALDFSLSGEGYFVMSIGENKQGFSRDGRFERRDSDGLLVSRAYGFPILGENGPIYLPNTRSFRVEKTGTLFAGDMFIDKLKVVDLEKPINLVGLTPAVFYFPDHISASASKQIPANAEVMQGFVEDSTVLKELAGRMFEYLYGHEGVTKVGKFYMKNMSQAVQSANP